MTGLSPNTALPTEGKTVKLCKNIFKIKDPVDRKRIQRTAGTTILEYFKSGNAETINQVTFRKIKTLPVRAMMRNKVLGSCQRKERNSDGNMETQSKTENR